MTEGESYDCLRDFRCLLEMVCTVQEKRFFISNFSEETTDIWFNKIKKKLAGGAEGRTNVC